MFQKNKVPFSIWRYVKKNKFLDRMYADGNLGEEAAGALSIVQVDAEPL